GWSLMPDADDIAVSVDFWSSPNQVAYRVSLGEMKPCAQRGLDSGKIFRGVLGPPLMIGVGHRLVVPDNADVHIAVRAMITSDTTAMEIEGSCRGVSRPVGENGC